MFKVITDWIVLAAKFKKLQHVDKKVVFTNGVFDLLHTGHLRYLQAARAKGDALCVAINSDRSVKTLNKGAERPILPQEERAELLAGLACVDFVTIFDEADPCALIKQATPDILLKGGDWSVNQILGADTVLAAGGEVLSLPFVEGRSTTAIIEKIKKNSQ